VEAHTNRALIKRAREVVVVADNSKLGRVAFARICTLEDADVLITDESADGGQIAALRAAGLAVDQV
jgi:DeoR family transcriptional regulator of aga operon